jgi:hypothetical protein
MPTVTITLIKLSNDRHMLSVTRVDGSQESRELTSREFLFHDLLHFAAEREADLSESFYGSLAPRACVSAVNRLAKLTPDRRPILTPCCDGVWRWRSARRTCCTRLADWSRLSGIPASRTSSLPRSAQRRKADALSQHAWLARHVSRSSVMVESRRELEALQPKTRQGARTISRLDAIDHTPCFREAQGGRVLALWEEYAKPKGRKSLPPLHQR